MSLHTAMGAIRLGLAAFMALLSLAGCQTIGPDGNPIRKFGLIQTRDGAQLSYIEVGSGKPIVLIPDWSQSAEQFKHQLNGLGRKYHVFALDLRGHGASSKVDHGYRLYRLSADLHDFLVERGLKDVTLVGHTMGCAVAFGYWELYGGERIGRLVLVDPVLAFAEHPGWTERDRLETGAIIDLKRLQDLETSLEGEEALRATQVLIRAMFTERFSRTEVEWAIGRNMELPRKFASHLLDDYAPIDWRAPVRRCRRDVGLSRP